MWLREIEKLRKKNMYLEIALICFYALCECMHTFVLCECMHTFALCKCIHTFALCECMHTLARISQSGNYFFATSKKRRNFRTERACVCSSLALAL